MENNNDNNLFTSMFGIESEEQKKPIQPEATPQPVIENKVVEQPVQPIQNPQAIQKPTPVVEEIITLDSNKPIVEETPIQVEQPSLNTINMNTNYKPVTPPHQIEEDLSFDTNNPNNYKSLCIILGITLVVVLLAFPLYIGLNNYFSKNADNSDNKVPEQVTPETPEQPTQQEEPSSPPINFDLNLSFENGYSTKPNEYQQKVPYVPESNEGVVKCETIKAINSTDGQTQSAVYFYYKDKLVKKVLTIDYIKLKNSQLYNQYLTSYQSFILTLQKNEHLFTKLEVDQNTYRMNFYMLADLAYNQATKIPDSKVYFDVKMSYNTPIKNAMSKFLTDKSFMNNMYCSTLVTADASL